MCDVACCSFLKWKKSKELDEYVEKKWEKQEKTDQETYSLFGMQTSMENKNVRLFWTQRCNFWLIYVSYLCLIYAESSGWFCWTGSPCWAKGVCQGQHWGWGQGQGSGQEPGQGWASAKVRGQAQEAGQVRANTKVRTRAGPTLGSGSGLGQH